MTTPGSHRPEHFDLPERPHIWTRIEFEDIQRGDQLRVVNFGAHSIEAVANHLSTPVGNPPHWRDRLDNIIVREGQDGAQIFRLVVDSSKETEELTPPPEWDVANYDPEPEPEPEKISTVVPLSQEFWQAVEEIKEPIRFSLIREFDVSGSSGTGRIADGVLWEDGSVALRWRGEHPSTAVWARIEDAVKVHGHGGLTKVRWIDIPPEWFRRAVGLAM